MFGYKPVVNDADATELVRSVVHAELVELDPIMGGDDFSAYLAEAPGCYAFVGAGGAFPHHHPRFVIDERALGDRHADARRCRATGAGIRSASWSDSRCIDETSAI